MTIKSLDCYARRVLVQGGQLAFHTSKGTKLIVPGMIFGLRTSHDGNKIRCILDDDINKVFTVTDEDYVYLWKNSISIEEAISKSYISRNRLNGKP